MAAKWIVLVAFAARAAAVALPSTWEVRFPRNDT